MGQPRRRPTLRDVARSANVSFKTVSRVVNEEGGVSPETLERVQSAIELLGYHPDDRARRLRTSEQASGVIGFVLVDVANPFFSQVLRGIEEAARKRDYLVLSGSTDGDVDRQHQLVSAFVARRVDGLIVVPSGTDLGPLGNEIDRGTPMVFVDLEVEGTSVDVLRSDHFGGSVLATTHLIDRGHRDIAFFGSPRGMFSAELRLAGFLQAMQAAGLSVAADRVLDGFHNPEQWQVIISEYLRDPVGRPTALYTAQNFVTIGAIRALHALGLQDEVALIGFDDIELGSVVHPGVSVIPQDPLELGRRAVEMLFNRTESGGRVVRREILSSAVVERGSGEIAPARQLPAKSNIA